MGLYLMRAARSVIRARGLDPSAVSGYLCVKIARGKRQSTAVKRSLRKASGMVLNWAANRRGFGAAIIGALALALAGCVETLPQLQANAPDQPAATRIPPRPGVSPAGATVAFIDLGGAPNQVGQRFAASMARALGARQIASEDPGKAHYLVRGHMSAYATEGGTAIAYVWDIYDSRRRRLQRLEDEIVVKGAPQDPWAAADDKTLATIAGRSADELAAFLTHTPEAGGAPAVSIAPAADGPAPGGSALSYAPLR